MPFIVSTRGLSAFVLALSPTIAVADGQFYYKLFGGASAISSETLTLGAASGEGDYDTGFLVGGAIGYDYANSPFRSEIEYTYRTGDAKTLPAAIGTGGDFASTSLMINGYYDFDTGTAWTPYVGIGVGAMTEVDFDVEGGAGEFSDSGVFAVQVMAGASYALSDRASLYGELRYFDAGSIDMTGGGGTLSTDYNTIDVLAGISFTF